MLPNCAHLRTGLTKRLRTLMTTCPAVFFSMEQAHVFEHFRHGCTKGSDVRVSTWTIFDPNAYPKVAN